MTGGSMIQIPMRTKAPIDQNSLTSLNHPDTTGALTSRNISVLNQPLAQRRAASMTGHISPGKNPAGTAENRTSGSYSQNNRKSPAGTAENYPRSSALQNNRSGRTTAGSVSHSQAAAQPADIHRESALQPVRLPALEKPVRKGQKTVLFADGTLPSVRACFGWNTKDARCDVDVSAFLLNENGKVPGDSWFVFYGQTTSPDQSTRFFITDSADREMITVDFTKLNSNVKKIVFVLTINDAFTRNLHFGMLEDAYIRLLDNRNTELVSFKMTDYYPNVISMMIGELYEHKGSWKFNAVGNGVARDLAGLCALYGVQVVE